MTTAKPDTTPVPNEFIEKFMPAANPVFSCVYITALHMISCGDAPDAGKIAALLGLREGFAAEALKYWEDNGLLQSGSVKIAAPRAPRPDTYPIYSPDEMSVLQNDNSDIRDLFGMAEQKLGKPLKYSEMNLFLSFYEWLKLPLEIIGALLDYCLENGGFKPRYMESIAVDWADNGIITKELLDVYLGKHEAHRKIFGLCGITSSNATPKQKQYMNKWLYDYGFPPDIIGEAADRCAVQTGNAKNFKYIDKILTGWHAQGVRNSADIEKADALYSESKQIEGEKCPVKSKNKKFHNFDERKWNDEHEDELRRKNRIMLEKKLSEKTPKED